MALVFADGKVTTTNSEQTLFDIIADQFFAIWLFFHNMTSTETMNLKIYVKDKNTNTMRLYQNSTIVYSDISDTPAICIPFLPSKEVKVTIQRTAGTDKVITWQRCEIV
jgi:hypothetical protein